MATDDLIATGERLDAVLLARHGEFLRFLERRLGTRADAEEVLQGAYARALEKGIPDDGAERVVAWFWITVNNAAVRLHRARQALKKQLLRACGACAAHGCLECHCRTGAAPDGKSPR